MKRYILLSVAVIMLFNLLSVPSSALSPPYAEWEQRVIPNQYTDILCEGNEYRSPHASSNPYDIPSKIDDVEIGEFLCKTTVTGYDEDKGKEHSISCDIYSLKSVSTEYAVAVEYEGHDGYYAFINPSYIPETLGDMIRVLGLRRNIRYRDINFYRWESFQQGDGPISIVYKMPDNSVKWDLLFLNTSSKGSKYNGDFPRNVDFMGTHIYDEITGSVLVLSIYPDGSLIVQLPLSNRIIFNVGEYAVQTFMEYVQTHGKSNKPISLGLWIMLGLAGTVGIITVTVIIIKKKSK